MNSKATTSSQKPALPGCTIDNVILPSSLHNKTRIFEFNELAIQPQNKRGLAEPLNHSTVEQTFALEAIILDQINENEIVHG